MKAKRAFENRSSQEVKKFGRPVSATPLTVLAKPKQHNDYADLIAKHPNDKLLNTLMREERLKMPRYPCDYGVYDFVEELKIKERVKPTRKEDYDEAINKALTKTIANPSTFLHVDNDRVSEMLQQEGLPLDKNWKELGPLLHEAMLVKSYEEQWFRDPIVKYLLKTSGKDLKLADDKTLFGELFSYLGKLDQSDREDQLSSLESYIDTSGKIAMRGRQIK